MLKRAPACPAPCLPAPQKLAVFTVESKWKPNKPLEAKNCYGTTSIEHPAVQVGTGRAEGERLWAPARAAPTRHFGDLPCE